MCVVQKVGKIHPAWQTLLVILLLPLFVDLLSRILQQVFLWLFGIDSHPLIDALVVLAVGVIFYILWKRAKRQRPTQNDTDIDDELERLQRENKRK
ncbi:MAG: hypothetical protein AAGA60_31775 [Cyanobacteria bacterium P01_E01_bin.42]